MDDLRDQLAEAMGLRGWDAHKWGTGRGHDMGKQTCRVCGIIDDAGDFPKMRCLRAVHPVPALDSESFVGWCMREFPPNINLHLEQYETGWTVKARSWDASLSIPATDSSLEDALGRTLLAVLKAKAVP